MIHCLLQLDFEQLLNRITIIDLNPYQFGVLVLCVGTMEVPGIEFILRIDKET